MSSITWLGENVDNKKRRKLNCGRKEGGGNSADDKT
jgi:hypothetical protein